jgi:hypothetical protein
MAILPILDKEIQMSNININTFYNFDGSVVDVLEIKARGWVLVKDIHSGETFNVRANKLGDEVHPAELLVPVADDEPEVEVECPSYDPKTEGRIVNTIFKLDNFQYSGMKTVSGRKCFDVADDVAKLFRGEDIDDVYSAVAGYLDTTVESLKARYGHLNLGMQRMNLGNRLRKAVNDGLVKL